MSISHKELSYLTAKKYIKQVALIEYKCTLLSEEPDVLIFDSYSNSVLYEIKVSLSDYYADFKKPHRIISKISSRKNYYKENELIISTLQESIGKTRFYVCPAKLINIEDLPLGWGLIWYYEDKNRFVIKKQSNIFKYNKGLECRLLINALRRVNEGIKDNILINEYIGIKNE